MHSTRLAIAILVSAVLASPAWAAIAPWPMGGYLAADPAGVPDLPVTRQLVTVDLRPARDGGPATVTAVYELNVAGNPGAAPLAVKCSTKAGRAQVTLDGLPVEMQAGEPAARPEWWDWPAGSPKRSSVNSASLTGSLNLTPGKHTLEVRYPVELYTRHAGEPTLFWEFEYRFAPVAGRPLEVTVHAPAGWLVRAPGPLTRSGDDLVGRYDAPPSTLSVSTQMPAPEESNVGLLTFLVAVLGGGLACGLAGLVLGRARTNHPWLWGMLAGVLYGGAVLGMAVLGLASSLGIPEVQQDRNHDVLRLDLIAAAFAVVIAFALIPIGMLLTVVGVQVGRAMAGRAPMGSP